MYTPRRRPSPPALLIFVGLYQEDLVRFRVVSSDDEEDPNHFCLQQTQSDHIHRGAINVLRSRGSLVASGGADGKVVVEDVEKGTSWDVVMPNEESVNSMDFGAGGRFLFVGGAERSLFYVNIKKRSVTCWKWDVHRSGVVAVRVRPPTERHMFTVGQERSMRCWDLYLSRSTETDEFRVERRFAGPISCVEFSPSGDMLVAAGENFARVNLVRNGRVVREVTFEGEKPVAAVWLAETVLIIGMSSGRGITLRIDDEGEPRWTRFYRDGKLTAMARAGKYLATTSNRSVVILWEILEEFRFWPLCQAEIVGKATSLVMMDVAELGLKQLATEGGKDKVNETATDLEEDSFASCLTQFQTSTTDSTNNSYMDTQPYDGGSNEAVLEVESADDESEVYQIIPETPPHRESSLQSLIDFPVAVSASECQTQREKQHQCKSASESSLESLRVSDEAPTPFNSDLSDGGSEEAEMVVIRSYREGLPSSNESGQNGYEDDFSDVEVDPVEDQHNVDVCV